MRTSARFAPALAWLLGGACQAPAPETGAAASTQRSLPFDAAPFPIVGWFENYNETLRGAARTEPLGLQSIIFLEGEVTGMRCAGQSQLEVLSPEVDPLRECAGREGRFLLRCTDGRVVQGQYWAETCGGGAARGTDQYGNRLDFVYGNEESALGEVARRALRMTSLKPELPRYDPASLRREKGFSTGTGFFVTAEGHLITSFHVIEGARGVEVAFVDGRRAEARYVGGDLEDDLALLKVDAPASPLPVASSDHLVKGQEVLTVGFPLIVLQGQEPKATFGRVNALSGINGDGRFAQVDLPIQPGNSGGPLVDGRGAVVGVITSTLNQLVALRLSGALPQNVNYAVKSDRVIDLVRGELGDAWAPETRSAAEDAEPEQLAERTEKSIVLVVAR
jgi:S1-C subfamily serine protease